MTLHRARCLCGLRLAMHRDASNASLTCAEARDYHRYAGIRFRPLRELMLRSVDGPRGVEVVIEDDEKGRAS
jgi:hypothetical protein